MMPLGNKTLHEPILANTNGVTSAPIQYKDDILPV